MLGRRQFAAISAGLPWILRGAPPAEAESGGLQLEYEARSPPAVPAPLELDPPGRLVVRFAGSGESAHCMVGSRVVLDGERGILPLAVWTADPHAHRRFREALRLPAFRGTASRAGGTWSLDIGGRRVFSATPGPQAAPAGPDPAPLPWFAWRFTLPADWRRGPLGPERPELWRLPLARPEGASSLDPAGCATAGGLDGWLALCGAAGPVAAHTAASSGFRGAEFVATAAPEALEPFAFRNYRAGAMGLVPESRLSARPEDRDAYRSTAEVRRTGLVIVSVDCFTGPAPARALVPPPCAALPDGSVRVMAIRGLDDPGLDEAWLLIECALHGRRAWYAASHLRPALEGSDFGREVFGYPTQDGEVSAVVGGNRFASSVARRGASLFRSSGLYGGFSTGTSLAGMEVVALRMRPRSSGGPPAGELVAQRWNYQGLRMPVHPASLEATVARPSGQAGDWSRLGYARPHAATVLDGAAMQRLPGVVAAEVADAGPYYRQRCDGRLPWERPPSGSS